MRARLVLLVVAGAVVGALAFRYADARAHEQKLSRIASAIAGRPVAVDCQGVVSALLDVDNHGGHVRFDADGTPADEARLDRDVCRSLEDVRATLGGVSPRCLGKADACPADIVDVAFAVDVLAHEAFHLRGLTAEAEVECSSLQTVAWTARRLGASRAGARALARVAWIRVYPYLADAYRTSECRDGGRLDLRPGSAVWP